MRDSDNVRHCSVLTRLFNMSIDDAEEYLDQCDPVTRALIDIIAKGMANAILATYNDQHAAELCVMDPPS